MSDLIIPMKQWRWIDTTINSLSCIASLILLHHLSKVKELNISMKCIGWIALTSFIQSMLLLISEFFLDNLTWVTILSVMASSSNGISLLWSAALAHYSCNMILYQKKWNAYRFYKVCCFVIAPYMYFLAAMFLVCYLLIDRTDIGDIIRNIGVFPTLIIGVLVSISSYIKQVRYIKQQYSKELLEYFDIKIGRLTLYPLVLITIYLPQILTWPFDLENKRWILQIAVFFSNLTGFVNALVFLYVRNLRFSCQSGSNGDAQTQIEESNGKSEKLLDSSFSAELNDRNSNNMLRSALQN